MMRANVLACDVRAEFLIAVLFSIKHQTAFGALARIPEFFGSQEYPEFQRHIETGQPGASADTSARDIVNSVHAIPDEAVDLFDADFPAIFGFLRTPGDVAAVMNCEDGRAKKRTVSLVERDV